MKRKILVVGGGFLAAAALAGLAAAAAGLLTLGQKQVVTIAQGECPHDWRWTGDTLTHINDFTGNRHVVPEYNDCQRFIEGSAANPKYGAVFAIFVSDTLVKTPNLPVGEPTSVALIVADGAYPKLHINGAGFYCLMLTNTAGNNWKGGIAPAGADADCKEDKIGTIGELKVQPKPFTTGVPGAVRWAFDPGPKPDAAGKHTNPGGRRWVHYAIVPCGKGVCSVGPDGFVDLPVPALLNRIHPGLANTGEYRQVDTWGDFQFLAKPSGGPLMTPVEPAMYSVIVPRADLASQGITEYKERWTPVAEVAVSRNNYKAKWNFSAASATDKYNHIDVCYFETSNPNDFSDTGNCSGIPEGKERTCRDKYDASGTPGKWRSRHISADGDTTYHCLSLKKFNPNLAVPGTVRWKWDVNDEKLWFRCPQGCCLVQE